MDTIREMPYSNEAEQAIIGSVLIDPDRITDILELIRPDDFYVEKNRHIFAGMVQLFNDSKPIDTVTLGNLLMNKGVYEAIGGSEYIRDIVTNIPLSLNVRSYSEIIKEKSVLRKLIKATSEITELCYGGGDLQRLLDLSITKVFDIAQHRDTQSVTHIKNIIYENYNKLSELVRNGKQFHGLPTGFTDIDNKLQGMQPGNLILIAARPGLGKSSLAANVAQNTAIRQNVPTAIFTLEMTKEEVANRIICSEAKINNMKIKSGDLNEEDIFKYIDALEPIANSPLYIDDTASISCVELRAKCKRLKLEKGLGVVVIDYLQLMTGSGRESRQQEISEISRSLKLLAKELDIPVIALSQLSRAVEQRKDDHRPVLSDLRESGAIEQDADVVMFLYRDEVYNENTEDKNIAECIISKNRAGTTGTAKLTWIGEFTTFYNMENIY